jgi:hypothetical protein
MRAVCFSVTLFSLFLGVVCGLDSGLILSAHTNAANAPSINQRRANLKSDAGAQDSDKLAKRTLQRVIEKAQNADNLDGTSAENFCETQARKSFRIIFEIAARRDYSMYFSEFEYSQVPLLI